ncbi:germacrene-D synthase-like [Sesamum indicum]|uniref:Germacrene-D synthase-like n=1 Tax=Sesamum indicum TaxID=4182 RepID=A0A6I9U9C7_SESIN|nr:germacrene-D synthase-like [Sesamum indicum]
MEFVSSNSPNLIKNVDLDEASRSVKYHPSVWGDYFLAYDSTEVSTAEKEELQRQKETVRKLLAGTPDDSLHKLQLIDAIQRLGVNYHFEEEIDKSLGCMHGTHLECSNKDNDLRIVALRFRLLRQQGYRVSCDVFNKFMDDQGNFKNSLTTNVQGMLELYEAAHFGASGEEILDKALELSSSYLQSYASDTSSSLFALVNLALEFPIRKNLIRLAAKKFISIYQEDASRNEILLNFAKLDFNVVQKIHQKELSDITRWWKALDFENKFSFARNRVVECYFWILGVYFERKYNVARRMLTKVIALTSVIDDIYDVYGTLDDLQLFTDVVQRWDVNDPEQLPPYIRICYKALIDAYLEMEAEVESGGGSYRVQYAKEEMKKLVRAYLEEAKWVYSKYMPTTKEYMKVALVSGAYMMLSTTSLVGMGNLVTKEDFDWVTSEPLIVRASSIICRLMDDMVGFGFEQKVTAVDCYMNEYGASKKDTFAEFRKQVKKAWKDINEECLQPTPVSMPVLMRVVNLARVINLLYERGDEYSNSNTKTKKVVRYVLVEPVAV